MHTWKNGEIEDESSEYDSHEVENEGAVIIQSYTIVDLKIIIHEKLRWKIHTQGQWWSILATHLLQYRQCFDLKIDEIKQKKSIRF